MKKKTKIVLLILTTSFSVLLNAQNMKLKVTIGNKEFTATLDNSEAAKEFVKMLPLEVNMRDHGGFEKTTSLSKSLPGRSSNPGRINIGDLMVWSGSSLVLFYSAHNTSYSYVKLGRIDNTSGMLEAMGRGSVKVKYELLKEDDKDKE
jgi:Uncharacterized conserved protein